MLRNATQSRNEKPFIKGQTVYVAYTEFNWWMIKKKWNSCFYEEVYIPQIFETIPYFVGRISSINENNMVIIFEKLTQDVQKITFQPYVRHEILTIHRMQNPLCVVSEIPEHVVTRQSQYENYCFMIYKYFLLNNAHPYTVDDLEPEAKSYLGYVLDNIKNDHYNEYIPLLPTNTNAKQVMKSLKAEANARFPASSQHTCAIPLDILSMFASDSNSLKLYGHVVFPIRDAEINVLFIAQREQESEISEITLKIPPSLFKKVRQWKPAARALVNDQINSDTWSKLESISMNMNNIEKSDGKGIFETMKYYNILHEHRVWLWWSVEPIRRIPECIDNLLIREQKVLVCKNTKQVYVPLNAINWWESIHTNVTLTEQRSILAKCRFAYIQSKLVSCNDVSCSIEIPLLGYRQVVVSRNDIEFVSNDSVEVSSCISTDMDLYHFTLGFIYRMGVAAYISKRFARTEILWNDDILDEVHEITVFKTFLELNQDNDMIRKLYKATKNALTMYEVVYTKGVSLHDLYEVFKIMLIQQYDTYDHMRFTNNVLFQHMILNGFAVVEGLPSVNRSTFFFDDTYNTVALTAVDERIHAYHNLEYIPRVLEQQTVKKVKKSPNAKIRILRNIQTDSITIEAGETITRFNGSSFTEVILDKAKKYFHPRDLLFAMDPSLKPPTIDDIIGSDLQIIESSTISFPKSIYYKLNMLVSYADTLHDFGQGTTTTMHMKSQQAKLLEYIKSVVNHNNNEDDAKKKQREHYLRTLVEGKTANFEASLLQYFNPVYLSTNSPNDYVDLVQMLQNTKSFSNKNMKDLSKYVVDNHKTYNVMAVRIGHSKNKDKSREASGLYTLNQIDQKNTVSILIKSFLGTAYEHCMINMTNIISEVFPGIAYSTASEFDRGVSKNHTNLLHISRVSYSISKERNEVFELESVAVKNDNKLYMKSNSEFVVNHEKGQCKPKKDIFKEWIRINENNGYVYRNAVKIINECYKKFNDYKPVLLDIKRSGDMLSSSSIRKWNEQNNKKVIFVSGDHLAVLKARLLGIPVIHTFKMGDGENWLHIYKPCNITVFENGGGITDTEMDIDTPDQIYLSAPSTKSMQQSRSATTISSNSTVKTGLVRNYQYFSEVLANTLVMKYNNRQDAKLLLLVWIHLSSQQAYVDSVVQEARRLYDNFGVVAMIQYLMEKNADGFAPIVRAYVQELLLLEDNIELLEMPMHKEFTKALLNWFMPSTDDQESKSYALDVIECLGYMFKFMEPRRVMKHVLSFMQMGFDGQSQAKARRHMLKLLRRAGITENDLIPIKFYESGIQDYLRYEDIDIQDILGQVTGSSQSSSDIMS